MFTYRLCILMVNLQDEVLAISERVVIRADDLLNWCDDTISWTYGLRANTLLNSSMKTESTAETSTNIRSLKNSKMDFDEVEKEKGELQRN